jgi:conjugative relaxase-like TrwC/TraI family protein
MVASISARGGAKAALAYYTHLQSDDYYTAGREPPGRWAGDGAERLSLQGPVTRAEFEAALQGHDPKTGAQLVQEGGRTREHAAGWDMTFSAPKSVSVLWALSNEPDRQQIEQTHRSAVLAATRHLEQTTAWARRGSGGSIDHHTSRESDPQLHTHSFVFNLAPRQDGSWGAIVSRELYKAQKTVGAVYRRELADGLERLGHGVERQAEGFRVAAIPREIERAFSKRRQAIEEAARTHGYSTPKGMELAALRTRRPKHDGKIEELRKGWQVEAKAIGFELQSARSHPNDRLALSSKSSPSGLVPDRIKMPDPTGRAPASAKVDASPQSAAQIGQALGQIFRSIDQPSGMAGLKPKLRNKELERE